jgi:hypothetical protein
MEVDLEGPDLAEYLAKHLSDIEFELLVRNRVKLHFGTAHVLQPNLGESHNRCSFIFNWDDKSQWSVVLGSTYANEVQLKGEVLSITVANALNQFDLQTGNKLSLLLKAPEEDE